MGHPRGHWCLATALFALVWLSAEALAQQPRDRRPVQRIPISVVVGATGVVAAGQAQPRDARPDPVARVSGLSDLKASTDLERELAGTFNWGFVPSGPVSRRRTGGFHRLQR